jgi:hypothetical protein
MPASAKHDEEVAMCRDHLEVVVAGAPPLCVTLQEFGLAGDAEQSCERGDSNPHSLAATGT